MRRDCQPCIINDKHEYQHLKRIKLTEKYIAELDLQTALHYSPELLPVTEIDSSYAPLKSLGMEISSIDNLFISPNGRITLVETKLWRNPQATREVVAQILDYAKRLNSWSYEEFEKKVKSTSDSSVQLGKKSLYEYVKEAFPEDVASEQEFIDEVQKTLSQGRFLLLIVGDGIKENIEGMVGMLQNFPQMLFTFGLVEIQIYEGKGIDGKLYVPQLVTHTTEIERAVVKVANTGQIEIKVDLDEDKKQKGSSTYKRRTLTESEFLDEIKNPVTASLFNSLLSFIDEVEVFPDWRASSVSVRMKDPKGSNQNFTIFVLTLAGTIYFGWLPRQLEKAGLNPDIAWDMLKEMTTVFPDATISEDNHGLSRLLTSEEVNEKYDEFTQIIKDTVNKIKENGEH